MAARAGAMFSRNLSMSAFVRREARRRAQGGSRTPRAS